jgi:hypothetical protein
MADINGRHRMADTDEHKMLISVSDEEKSVSARIIRIIPCIFCALK